VVGQTRLLRIDHVSQWASQWEDTIVFAIALVLTFAVAAARTTGWRVPTWIAAIALAGYGLVSTLSPDQASSWAESGDRQRSSLGPDADVRVG
ncbi:MAG: hypothetical protein ABIS18_06575, partial [Actinomycetota bacterium]